MSDAHRPPQGYRPWWRPGLAACGASCAPASNTSAVTAFPAPNNIRQHRCVRHLGLAPRSEWPFRVNKRDIAIPITSIVTCNEIDSAVNACIDGLGLGMFLSYMVATNRKDGQLKYVLEKFETEPIPVQLVYPSSKLLSTRVRAFIDEASINSDMFRSSDAFLPLRSGCPRRADRGAGRDSALPHPNPFSRLCRTAGGRDGARNEPARAGVRCARSGAGGEDRANQLIDRR